MARNSGKRPHELTLDLFAQNATQTPTEIDAFVKNGPYSSKHIWFLRKLGYDISVNKQGRTVLSYTYNGVGTATAAAAKPAKAAKAPAVPKASKAPAVPKLTKKQPKIDMVAAKTGKLKAAAPAPKIKAAVVKTDEQIKISNLAKMKSVTAKIEKRKIKERKEIDQVADTFGTTGEVATSYNIDGDWDSIDGIDLMKII